MSSTSTPTKRWKKTQKTRSKSASPLFVPLRSQCGEDQYDELEDDDSAADGDEPEDEPEDDVDDDPDNNDPKNKRETDRLEETTACAASPAQALPRDIVRGQNPNDRSPSDRTDCAASPAQPSTRPAQPAAPQKPKPDADGLIWHPHPGYPNQERSGPDAQGRVFYKIHMTTPASQLPPRQTDAQRAAKLIYGSVIKKYGNP
ncbi:MAG: hypothetical protein WAK24_11535 [Candidatus Acidiferrales bacterium]